MKKILFSTKLILLVIMLCPTIAFSAVTTTPSTISVPSNRAYLTTITYNFSNFTPPLGSNSTSSSVGTFKTAGGAVLGYVRKRISVNLNNNPSITGAPNYSGTASETLNIPFSVIQNAIRHNVNSFQYVRNFSSDPAAVTTTVNIRIINPASMPLTINRVSLYFQNRKAETTVKRNEKLYAFVDISFSGSGLLKGYWEIDGHMAAPRVFKYITYGTKVTLKTPDTSQINTFETGTHFIKFVITSPQPAFEMPKAIYYVSGQPAEEVSSIKLLSPRNNDSIEVKEDEPVQFIWKNKDGTYFYLLEFFQEDSEKPVFSAYTKSSAYSMPPYIARHYFNKGKYRWLVIGFDENSNTVAKSNTKTFIMK